MPLEIGDLSYVLDMFDSAKSIVEMTESMDYQSYSRDRRTRRAIEREIEIIGEAARKISSRAMDAHPEIPWRRIIAQRHRLAHEYGEIQDEIIWNVAKTSVPELLSLLEPLLKEGGSSPESPERFDMLR